MARILILGGEERGVRLAGRLVEDGHAVRLVAPAEERRESIEGVGAECFLGSPDRLATLSGALEHVTVACWLMATAKGPPEAVAALHGPRLEQFLASAVDSTLRGFLYETAGSTALREGERIVRDKAARNEIPVEVLRGDPRYEELWLEEATGAIARLLAG